MALISGTIPSLIGGASQQDATIRHTDQQDDCINCWLDPAQGNGKRPPTEFINVLGNDISPDALIHSITRDSKERYLVVVEKRNVRVFDHITGKAYVTNWVDEAFLDYIDCAGRPRDVLRAVTVADTTFIINTEKTVELASTPSPGVLGGNVQTFEDLPDGAPVGALYEVSGSTSNQFDQYYVQRSSKFVWQEVAQPGGSGVLDKATMPHELLRIPDNTNPDGLYFGFGPRDWDIRAAGDGKSNAPPSFVGSQIDNGFFHRDRLGWLAGGNVIMSEVGHPFNFWRTTVTDLLDSDPIDRRPPGTDVAHPEYALPYRSALFLISPQAQYVLTATDQGFSPKTVQLNLATKYPATMRVAPIMSSSSLYFMMEHGLHSSVMEYFASDSDITGDAADVSAHIPNYIPDKPSCIEPAPQHSALFVAHEADDPYQVYVYQYRWQDATTKVQSAWGRWKFSGVGTVRHLHVIGQYLYVVADANAGGLSLLRVDLTNGSYMPEVSTQFDVLLDRRSVVTGSWQQFGNYTDFALPYALDDLSLTYAMKTTSWATPGALLDITGGTLRDGGTTLRMPGDLGGKTLVIGEGYTQEVPLSEQFLRTGKDKAIQIGRLQLRTLGIRYLNSGYWEARVSKRGRPDVTERVIPAKLGFGSGRAIGDADFTLGSPDLDTGLFRFLVAGNAKTTRITLANPTPYPSQFQSVVWEGFFTSRTRV